MMLGFCIALFFLAVAVAFAFIPVGGLVLDPTGTIGV